MVEILRVGFAQVFSSFDERGIYSQVSNSRIFLSAAGLAKLKQCDKTTISNRVRDGIIKPDAWLLRGTELCPIFASEQLRATGRTIVEAEAVVTESAATP
jgi:hypothetical protein